MHTEASIVLLGGGGHARVLLSALRTRRLKAAGYLALAPADSPGWPADVPYLGDDGVLQTLNPARIRLINAVGSTGDTAKRRRVFALGKDHGFAFETVVHPSAVVDEHAVLGEGAQIMAQAVVQTGVEAGANVLVNTGALVEHDVKIRDHAHLATGACVCGGVHIGIGVHVGAGAVIRQGLAIGDGAVVGAGAVVVRDVAAGVVAAGNPARPLPGRPGSSVE